MALLVSQCELNQVKHGWDFMVVMGLHWMIVVAYTEFESLAIYGAHKMAHPS